MSDNLGYAQERPGERSAHYIWCVVLHILRIRVWLTHLSSQLEVRPYSDLLKNTRIFSGNPLQMTDIAS